MSIKRVQKLLFSEYCDFEDMVLIESPFAQTTRDGKGIRQVHIGLTPSKLILATDVLPPVERSCFKFLPGIDPAIETFELIAIYPIECVNLSIFRRRKRQAIKAHFCNNRVFYFELGGFEKRNMFWNLWCEKLKFLSPESGSSHSETSVATSSTSSTLYLLDSKQVTKPNGLTQVWCKFGTGKSSSEVVKKWTDRHLFLGKQFDDLNYKPMMSPPKISDFLKPKPISNFCVSSRRSSISDLKPEVHIGDSYQINRFGSGVREGCSTSLFLPAEDYIVPRRFSQSTGLSSEMCDPRYSNDLIDFHFHAEDCVKLWEMHSSSPHYRSRHKRRYGFAPQPLFLHGLGPWNVSPGARFSVQVKRAVSLVTIRRQPAEAELRLPVTKRQLIATISCDNLHTDGKERAKINNMPACGGPRRPVIFFWTPDYWYRPRSARDAYLELQKHLKQIKEYQRKAKKRRRLFRRRIPVRQIESSNSDSDCYVAPGYKMKAKKEKKSLLRFNVFGSRNSEVCDTGQEKDSKETSLQYLKRLLKIDVVLTAWDFNSTTLAQQLTMVDRDLYLKISTLELSVLIWQQSSKNAPNIAALIAFAHRISCLVATDILKNECERTRARLVSRFINVAYKCHKISNFHSCRSVLFGLQSPAIYRLKSTWAYVRKKHASKYEIFEILCKLYRDPRLISYQKAFFLSSQDTPYLPFIGDLIAKLLDRIPDYKLASASKAKRNERLERQSNPCECQESFELSSSDKCDENQSSLFTKLLMSMKLVNFDDSGTDQRPGRNEARKGLCDYFKPLDCYEDNRMKCLVETTEFLQQSQLSALHYSFMHNSLALDYLLKARYKEERDNFYESFRVENLDCARR